jgi:hypothetical protein
LGCAFALTSALTPNPSPKGRGKIHLSADGLEVHEPGLEEGPRHLLQRLAHPPVQLDLVVQRAQDVGDGALFGEGRDQDLNAAQVLNCNVTHRGLLVFNMVLENGQLRQ